MQFLDVYVHTSVRYFFSPFFFVGRKGNNTSYRHKHSTDYPSKLRGVFTDHKSLIREMQKNIRISIEQTMKFSLFDTSKQKSIIDLSLEFDEFLWCYLLKDILVNIDKRDDEKQMMIDYCRSQYQTNDQIMKQIEKFEKNYKAEDAIEWYTKDSFVYRLVNKSIRSGNIDALFKLGFFITDLSTQLKVIWEKTSPSYQKVYHWARLTNAEMQKLNSSTLISPNGYMSTSLSLETASIYAVNTIFEIEIDPAVENIICANITEYSQFFEEEEILFDLGCTFRILSVDHDDNQRLIVKMTAVNEVEKLANTFIQTIQEKKKTKGYFNGLVSDFVHHLGYSKGLEFYEQLLTLSRDNLQKITKNCSRYWKYYKKHSDVSNVIILYGLFAWFLTQRAEYDLAIKCCTHALSLVEKTPAMNSIDNELAMIYNTMGWSYYEKGDYSLALDWCQRARKMLEDCPSIEYSKYAKILRSEEKLTQCSTRNDAEYTAIHTNIGSIYFKRNQFDMAMFYCKKSMAILENLTTQMVFTNPDQTIASKKELDNHHETIAANYEVFANIDYQNGNYLRTLDYYRKAHNIFETITPRIPICLQRSPAIFGRNKQRLQNSIRATEKHIVGKE